MSTPGGSNFFAYIDTLMCSNYFLTCYTKIKIPKIGVKEDQIGGTKNLIKHNDHDKLKNVYGKTEKNHLFLWKFNSDILMF